MSDAEWNGVRGADSWARAERAPAAGAGEDTPRAVPWTTVAVFVAVAMALAWAVALPLWLAPLPPLVGRIIAVAMMYTPAVAVVVVALLMRGPRAGVLRFLGVWPLRPVGRVLWLCAAGIVSVLLCAFAAIALSAALGFVELDLAELSGFRELLESKGADIGGVPLWPIAIAQLASLPIAAIVPNSLTAFGEEIGWRGWLTAALRPRGVWPTLLITGVVWGLWHAPLVLLGFDFGRRDALGVVFMVVACVLLGILFGWLRLRSGSVWPAVVAHGALNAVGEATLLFTAAGTQPDPALIAPMGVPMWIVLAVVIAVLALCGQFRADRLVGFAPDAPRRP